MNEFWYRTNLFMGGDQTLLALAMAAAFLGGFLAGIVFFKGARGPKALALGAATLGLWWGMSEFTDGSWAYWTYKACIPLIEALGGGLPAKSFIEKTLAYALPAGLSSLALGILCVLQFKLLARAMADKDKPDQSGSSGGGKKPSSKSGS